ncbi:MAG: M56 family metallopeptidase, partial [Geothrix sp.]|uniref:M56 family metallopeptidase n=1 Tax=Geothrix sp. TaxID=1962974 RepID=UPI003BAFA7F3
MTTLLSLVSQPWAQTLGWTLLHFLWQGAALGLAAWLGLVLLRGSSAKARYGLACAFLLLMVAAPTATALLLQRQVPTPLLDQLNLAVEAARPVTAPAAVPLAQRVKATLDPALPWLLAGWAAGVLLLSIRFLGSWVRVQRLRRRSASPVAAEWHLVLSRLCRELKLSRTVRLLQSAAVEVPTALGWLRPVILLPACALAGLSPLQLEAILAHELAHIRRGDFLVNLLQSLVEVLLFYHPAIWWLSARIRAERELCCDDVAASLCGDPLILARALTDLEALREPLTPTPTHLALAANGGSLMQRVRHLLYPALPITTGARATALAVLAASLLGAAGVALQDKAPEGATKADKTTRIKTVDDKRQLDVRMKGDVKLNGEAPEPVTVAGDGSFRAEEKKDGRTRSYATTKDKATYTVDGKEVALDKEGRDWLRSIATEAQKAQAGRSHAQRMKVQVELDRAEGEQERARAEGRREHVVEIGTRHSLDMEKHHKDMAKHQKDMERHQLDLEVHAKELAEHAKTLSPEERARVQAEMDRARAELAKAAEEMKKEIRVEVRRHKGEGGDHEPRMEVITEEAGPGTVVIRKKVDGKDVVETRRKVIRKGGDGETIVIAGPDGEQIEKHLKVIRKGGPKEGQTWTFVGPEGEDLIEKDIHIPPIHIPEFHFKTRGAKGELDTQAEIQALQSAMKSLQTRLDQLQKQVSATPKAPKTPRTPATPRSAHPAVPPPPPPPPPPAPD